jgi:histidine triad (HIT) family protein
VVLVPKRHDGLTQLQKATEAHKPLLGHLIWAAAEVARREGLAEGYRIVINDGPNGCQSVYHLHLHIIGGKKLSWPPGTGHPEGSMKG